MMRLHLDQPVVETLLFSESEGSGIRADILEKDCSTTLILTELTNKQIEPLHILKEGPHFTKQSATLRGIKTHMINRLLGE
jgi:hypothetical protein